MGRVSDLTRSPVILGCAIGGAAWQVRDRGAGEGTDRLPIRLLGGLVGFLARLREHRRTVASVSTVSVFSTALVGLALFTEGEATADVDLNDSGVWVTKTSAGLLGRFNYESQAMDGTLNAGSASFDVQQDAGRVLLEDAGTGTASPVNVAHLKLDGLVRLPAGAQVASGARRPRSSTARRACCGSCRSTARRRSTPRSWTPRSRSRATGTSSSRRTVRSSSRSRRRGRCGPSARRRAARSRGSPRPPRCPWGRVPRSR